MNRVASKTVHVLERLLLVPSADPSLCADWCLGPLQLKVVRRPESSFCITIPRQKMPVINIEDLTEKDKLKMEVDQLKKEVTLERMLVSKCCEEFRDYVEERSGEDPLVKGIPEDKNPFKELKGGCVIS
ncbi:guanine nucleotide-binding protein G(T) subunit gamma-T1 isoform X1 [Bubalus kerabau]|uniref:guanine nucleotide-binding protein G(T) subunit gamma-T1 isoform X1 n=1 Tax=Bubalus carabanensis TaxID=3119969 RepID=UPI00244E6DFC|nr:guanine nucleotide-binding protein G(T) subunit gamma-T1 isoform X1 [Bubalus carabanensis]